MLASTTPRLNVEQKSRQDTDTLLQHLATCAADFHVKESKLRVRKSLVRPWCACGSQCHRDEKNSTTLPPSLQFFMSRRSTTSNPHHRKRAPVLRPCGPRLGNMDDSPRACAWASAQRFMVQLGLGKIANSNTPTIEAYASRSAPIILLDDIDRFDGVNVDVGVASDSTANPTEPAVRLYVSLLHRRIPETTWYVKCSRKFPSVLVCGFVLRNTGKVGP